MVNLLQDLCIVLPAARRDPINPQAAWDDVRVALASVAAYAPDIDVVLAWSGTEKPENLPPNDRVRLIEQPSDIRTGSAAWNFAASQTDASELLILGDDCVITPDLIELFRQDVSKLADEVGLETIGYVGCRSNFAKGPQNIRMANGAKSMAIKFDTESQVMEIDMIVPVCAWIRHEVYDSTNGFENTNWFADDLMSYDLKKLGYRHFVSRAYCHHVGQRATAEGKSDEQMLEEGLAWLRANRQDFLQHLISTGAMPASVALGQGASTSSEPEVSASSIVFGSMSEEAAETQAGRDPKRVVFLGRSGGRFIDNAKYAFLHFARNEPDYDAHFVTAHPEEYSLLQSHGLPTALLSDPHTTALLEGAGVAVSDDLGWRLQHDVSGLLDGCFEFQLWHGMPLKAIGFTEIATSPSMDSGKKAALRRAYSNYDAVLSTAEFWNPSFAGAFEAPAYPVLGYPRIDALLTPPTSDTLINVDTELLEEVTEFRRAGGRVVAYLPTFREDGNDPVVTSNGPDLDEVSRIMQKHNGLFLLKMHPYLPLSASGLPPNVRVIESQSDPYPVLAQTDMLLTDYSSVAFDYLVLDRPLLFYPYDLQRYVSENRSLLFDYAAMSPGPKAMDSHTFARMLAEALDGRDEWQAERAKLTALIHTYTDASSAARVADYIKGLDLSGA